MPAIAILDDRSDNRDTVSKVVRSILKKIGESGTWGVVADAPPSKERDVLHWLDENDAAVLVTDWKLNEGAKGKRIVNYEADGLIREIRAKRPTFPIFVITGFESEAQAHLKDVENVFGRRDFTRNAETVVTQMVRAGLRRYEEQRELLERIDRLARKAAVSKASAKELQELRGLQGHFQSEQPPMVELNAVLKQFEAAQKKAEALRARVQKRLGAVKSRR